jgi:phosphoribosylaminoimidazole-succinocarboxamide synthase
MENVLLQTDYTELPRIARGKVRDIYDLGDRLLIVATDRISAFDFVLPAGIPGKGRVLNRLSTFWFGLTRELGPNHLLSTELSDLPASLRPYTAELEGRFMIVKKVEVFPVECIVRGYLAGSGFKDYNKSGAICGIPLPEGLREADRLPEPLFTPTTKATSGHDEPITFDQLRGIVGDSAAEELRRRSFETYALAAGYAETKGILIADTKLEWGVFNGDIVLADEIFTPDSSRFWPKDRYEPGRSQESFDKQFIRDYLESTRWDKTPPVPEIPDEVVQKTAEKYRQALFLLTGESL